MKELTKEEMIEVEKKCAFHHSAYFKGYISRLTNGRIEPYQGRYGSGYKIYKPCWNSTWYSVVEYWIYK